MSCFCSTYFITHPNLTHITADLGDYAKLIIFVKSTKFLTLHYAFISPNL